MEGTLLDKAEGELIFQGWDGTKKAKKTNVGPRLLVVCVYISVYLVKISVRTCQT